MINKITLDHMSGLRISAVFLLAFSTAGCASSAGFAQGAYDSDTYQEDSMTCERFGADRGRAYTQCMLDQQRRRDEAALNTSEQIRNLTEAGRNNAEAARENLETVRRIRCNRAAKRARERGEQPERCR